jgi:hypothetical protein
MKDKKSVEPLVASLHRIGGPAMVAIRLMGDPSAIAPLFEETESPGCTDSVAAYEAIGDLFTPDSAPVLLKQVLAIPWDRRWLTLCCLDRGELSKKLEAGCGDGDPVVAQSCRDLLDQITAARDWPSTHRMPR